MEAQVQNNVEIMITNISLKGDGFATVRGSSNGVYIPPSVTKSSAIIPGEIRLATLIDNDASRQHLSRFKAIFVAPASETERSPDGLRERILELVEDSETCLTTREIAREIGIVEPTARDHLTALFSAGRVSRADILHRSADRPVDTLWGIDPKDFL